MRGAGKRWRWLMVPMAAATLTGCGSDTAVPPGLADRAPIVVPDPSGRTGQPLPSAASVTGEAPSSVTDAQADIEIADQVGDGRSVVLESVDTALGLVHIVIETADGRVLGSDLRTSGLQPVTLRLSQPVSAPTTLIGRMLADDGDGILERGIDQPVIDEEGEQVDEDFDYRLPASPSHDG